MAERSLNLKRRRKAIGVDRFEAIAPLLQLLDVPISRRFPHLLLDGTRVRSFSEGVRWCASNAGVHPKTSWLWLARFRKGGERGREPAGRGDKGRSRFFARHKKAAVFAAYLHLALRPQIRVVRQAIFRNRELLEVPESKLPCCDTVRAWL